MNTSCTTRTIKYLIFSFNFVFVITGIVLIAVGASIHSNYTDYELFLDGKYFTLPNLLIATGSLIFFISFLGCYGAFKESWLMLMAFSVLLAVICIFEFSAGIAGYVLRDKTMSYLEDMFSTSLSKYTSDNDTAKMWDRIQEEFQCCGINDPSDWLKALNKSNNLPISCCPMVNGVIGTFNCTYDTTPAPTVITTITETSVSETATTESAAPTTESVTTETTPTESTTVESKTTETVTVTESVTVTVTESTTSIKTTLKLNDPLNKLKSYKSNDEPFERLFLIQASTSTPYKHGCVDKFGDWVKDHAVHIGVVGFLFAIIQVAGVGFACHLSRQLKNRYYST